MQLQQAISLRIMELVHENGITLNQLAERSGLSASSITRTVKTNSSVSNTTTGTVLKMCSGLGIPFKAFWESPLFDDIDTIDE
ncbi:helix-turn-helix domain-containing protein [uncultured Gemmiger sp.]|uniref:helix-turn-helix domain-containing protein n=1 Tax=Gemmiger sp. TaxID=2049027 RepID=UPI0025F32CCA|nr:helix-turn-helix transcriptional regulator [uncultured Gemmiger sp.]